ncbi:ATP-grasp domain-containing protein [Streptomyces sp. NPDC059506]|uniref:ATP-grasp domain-containing protein n=1 Tax=unclassified Streptomyces TaxID=2593676 RepID=UPI0022AAA85C|nr:ATP-grasp domain-containing protein [Streptomyces sp. HB2AG]MCZ2526887.1 ATP-grasp domain-containing protein [Streptomyces sp. HB2AG]
MADDQQRTVLLVGAGVMAEGYLHAARAMGLRVGVVETPARHAALADRFPCIVDFEPVDEAAAGRDESWTAPAATLAARLRPDAVWAFAEPHVLAAAMVQHRLGLPGPGLDAAVVSRNKALQRAEFGRTGLPQPAHRHTRRLSESTGWALERLPVVVKPVSSQGSQGVERIGTPDDWADAVARRDAEGPLLVEQYVEGREYSVEALVHRGRVLFTNLTRKETTGPPHFVELLHEAGHGADRPVLRKAADELCRGVVAALGMVTGVAHLEFRAVADDEPVIMEVAVRTPGDHIMELVARAHGFDVFGACLRLALGEEPSVPDGHGPVRSAGSLFLSSPGTGTLAALDLSAWAGRPEVARYDARLAPGARVRPAEDSGDRLAWAVLDCDSPGRMRELARELAAGAVVELAEDAEPAAGV